jgi:hypothetical protein
MRQMFVVRDAAPTLEREEGMRDWKLLTACAMAALFVYASDPQAIRAAHGAAHSVEADLGIEQGRAGAHLSLASWAPDAATDDPKWIEERLREEDCCSWE